MTAWTPSELKMLKKLYEQKPPYVTDAELARRISGKFNKSAESVRWQIRNLHHEAKVGFPKILLMDIETLPMEGSFWNTRKVYIRPEQIRKDWSVLSWSAKWLFDTKVMGQVVQPQEAIDRRDDSILEGIWKLLNEADIVITQNGDYFDFKKINTRFLIAGYPKPMYYRSVDTYKVLTENFAFTYNSMDYVNSVLGIGRKIATSWKWWDECAQGSKKYLKMMLEYNKHDVGVLEELYLRLRPWITNHANLGVFSVSGTTCCPSCGDNNLSWEGKYQTPLGLYKAFRCQSCASIGRSTLKQFKLAGAKVRN